MIKIRNFPENARITFLGSLFQHRRDKEWNINIGLERHYTDIHFSHEHKYMIKHARFHNMPLLAKNRRFYQTQPITPYNESIITIKIDNFRTWQTTTNSSGQYMFSHIVSDLHGTHKDIQIHLPQIELARVLFFHNAYLSRTALKERILSLEFHVLPQDDDKIIIYVPEICNFPKHQFNNVGMRRLLSWILLDTEARAAYDSISHKLMMEKIQTKTQTFWNFNFLPPSLKEAEITMKIYFSEKYQQYYVNEIIAISNLPSDISHEVTFCSPTFTIKKTYKSSGDSSGRRTTPPNKDPEIDDDQEASSDSRTTTIASPKIVMSLAEPFETKKAAVKSSGKKGSFNPNDLDPLPDNNVGTGESSIFGEIGRGEFENIQDESDDLEFIMKRFEAFRAMVEQFASQHDIQPIIRGYKLPAVNRSRLHQTMDGNNRSILEIKLTFKGKKFVILEVDTSDNQKPLSTLIIKVADMEAWDIHFPKFQRQIIKRSLRWPTAQSLQNIGVRKTINHPRNMVEVTESDKDFKGWGKRLEEVLESI